MSWVDSGGNVYITSGNAGIGAANFENPLFVQKVAATTNTVEDVVSVSRVTSGTAAAGLGGRLRFVLQDAGGSLIDVGGIAARWDDPATANRHARLDFYRGKQNAVFVAMSINKDGQVGIGTTSPDTPLMVQTDPASTNTVEDVATLVRGTSGTPATGLGGRLRFVLQDAGGNLINVGGVAMRWDDPSTVNRHARLDFYRGKQNSVFVAMSINKDGRVGIGTTSPEDKFHVSGGNILLDNGYAVYVKPPGGCCRWTHRTTSMSGVALGRRASPSIVMGLSKPMGTPGSSEADLRAARR